MLCNSCRSASHLGHFADNEYVFFPAPLVLVEAQDKQYLVLHSEHISEASFLLQIEHFGWPFIVCSFQFEIF